MDDKGDVLKECQTRMDLMRSAGVELGKKVGSMGTQIDKLTDTVSELSIETGVISRLMNDEVLPALRGLPAAIVAERRQHEESCPLLGAAQAKTRKDVTERLLVSRPPLTGDGLPAEIERNKWLTRQNLIIALGGLGMAAIGAITKWITT